MALKEEITAVSALNILLPKDTGKKLYLPIKSISLLVKSPSGPMAIVISFCNFRVENLISALG